MFYFIGNGCLQINIDKQIDCAVVASSSVCLCLQQQSILYLYF